MIIHCVGDSHANFFSGFDEMQPEWPAANIKNRVPCFRSYRIGPVLAYKLCDYGTTSMGREKLDRLLGCLEPGSFILFCFGEIDCRAHVLLQAERQNREPEAIIKEVIDRYLSIILEVSQSGFRPLIWNVIPSAPSDINNRITVPPQYLFHGSREERNRVTRIFNKNLKRVSNRAGIPFIDIFDRLITADDSVDQSYYSDEIHLSRKAIPIVLKALEQIFLGHSFNNGPQSGDGPIFLSPTP